MSKEELLKELNNINECLINEIENLKYLLDNTLIEYINLLNIHFIIKDLLNKRQIIKNELYDKYNILITDEI